MKSLNFSINHGIATLTLNRPEQHNALNEELIESLIEHLEKVEHDPTIRVLLFSGKGKSFCAGADIQHMQQMANFSEKENQADAMRLAILMQRLYQLSKPTIALVHGAVYGGGIGVVACCDMAFASTDTVFCFSEVKLGLIPAVISPFVIKAIGIRQTQRYFLSAERFDAYTAQTLGLVTAVVEPTQLEKTTEQFAQRLLKNSPAALSAVKKLIRDVDGQPIDANLLATVAKHIADIRVSSEAQAGLKAYLKKEAPPWG